MTSVVSDSIANNQPTYYGHERNVARTGDGVALVAWQDSSDQISYSTFDAVFSIWSPAIQLTSAGDEAHKVALISDANGDVHAAWQQRTTSGNKWEIWHSRYTGGLWLAPVKAVSYTHLTLPTILLV